MLLSLKNISKSFGNPDNQTFQAVLRELNFEVSEGESLAILGPSGSGKSTLLNIIGALDQADTGSYSFRGKEMSGYAERELDHFRNKEIGFVFQSHHLLPQCNVLENVLIPTLVSSSDAGEKLAYAEEMLQKVGLFEHKHKMPGQLSGGECQRVALVRAIINKPSLLLADEPSGALDKENVKILTALLLKMNLEEQLSLVLVTHSRNLAEQMQTIYELEDGQLVKR